MHFDSPQLKALLTEPTKTIAAIEEQLVRSGQKTRRDANTPVKQDKNRKDDDTEKRNNMHHTGWLLERFPCSKPVYGDYARQIYQCYFSDEARFRKHKDVFEAKLTAFLTSQRHYTPEGDEAMELAKLTHGYYYTCLQELKAGKQD